MYYDMIKAFDNINHFALFHLMKKSIPMYLTKIFLLTDFVSYVAELNGEMAILVIFIFLQECLGEAFKEGIV